MYKILYSKKIIHNNRHLLCAKGRADESTLPGSLKLIFFLTG